MNRSEAATASDEWLGRMNLTERAKEKLDALSKGNQQKVQFIASILHRPAFAVLDEPFSGLDPLNQDFFLDLLRELRDGGMTILLSAHQMALVERVADRFLLMNHGQTVRVGTLDQLRESVDLGTRISFRVRGSADPGVLQGHPAVASASTDGPNLIQVELRRGESLSGLLQTAGHALDVVEVRSQPPGLHDIYVQALKQSGQPIPEAETQA
jgi:ABC-2 type transport system ATP-binding protein